MTRKLTHTSHEGIMACLLWVGPSSCGALRCSFLIKKSSTTIMEARESKNTKTVERVKIDGQPVSSYPYLAFRLGFNSLREVAEHFDVDYDELVEEVKNSKCAQRKVISGPVRKLREKKNREKLGELMPLKKLHEITGTPIATLQKRRQRGINDEKSIEMSKKQNEKKKQSFKPESKTYHSASELGCAYGMSYQTVQARVNAGMTDEEIVFAPLSHKGTRKKRFIGGKNYDMLSLACQEYKVSEASVYSYMSEHKNANVSDVIIRKASGPAFCYSVYGVEYPTLKAVAAAHEVDYQKLCRRVYSGKYEYIEDAIEAIKNPPKKPKKTKKAKHTVFGKGFRSHREICEYYGISVPNYSHHLYKLKESPEEIVAYFQNKDKGVK